MDLPRVLTVAGAFRVGLTRSQVRTELRHGRWRRLAAGIVLTRPEEPTRVDWMHVGMALGAPAAAISGWDVVRRHGLGPVAPPDEHVLVLTRGGHHRRVGGLRIRPSDRILATSLISLVDDTHGGILIAAPARAVADTALCMRNPTAVRAMVTSSVQKGLCTPAQLITELEAGPQQGSAMLRLALADVIAGARSVAEAEAIRYLKAVGVGGFLANAPIYDDAGRLLYRVDLFWPALNAIVEIDSREFHFGERDWDDTMRRHDGLTGLGFAVTHYPPGDVRNRKLDWAREVDAWLRTLVIKSAIQSSDAPFPSS